MNDQRPKERCVYPACDCGPGYCKNVPRPSKPLVERLRRKTVAGQAVFPTPLDLEAADEIERLTRILADDARIATGITTERDALATENQRLRAALEPPNKEYAQRVVQQAVALWGKPRGVRLGAETHEWLLRMVGIGRAADETSSAPEPPMLTVRIYKGDDVIVDAKELMKYVSYRIRVPAEKT